VVGFESAALALNESSAFRPNTRYLDLTMLGGVRNKEILRKSLAFDPRPDKRAI
jgi:hypothetical protein